MAEHVMGPSQTLWQINTSGIAPVYVSGTVSVSGNLGVVFDPTDTLYVTQSGNYFVTLGSTNIDNVITGSVVQKTSPWIVLGSVDVSNNQTGSVVQSTNPWIILGSVAVSNNQTGSVVQSTNPWIVLGSQAITNVITGSVVQSTNPWITLGSVQVTNPPFLGSTYYVSGVQDSSIKGLEEHEQLNFIAGSPTNKVSVFTSGVVDSIIVKCVNDTYVDFDKAATTNSFLIDAGQSLSANLKVGSVNTLYKTAIGSVWVWGGR